MNRYENVSILKTKYTNRPYYKNVFYPKIPLLASDEYIITTVGDRLDGLAYNYYGDSTLWWIISVANDNVTRGTLFPSPGTQLRIPVEINYILNFYQRINQAR